jgi:thiol peroxidase
LNEGAFNGLLARAVVVADESGKVLHTELVADIGSEPNYDAAVQALS